MSPYQDLPGPRMDVRDGMRLPVRVGFGVAADPRPTALLVEDDFGTTLALTVLLERVKFNVVTAPTGHQALDVLDEREDIDIVLMDIMMPGMDGYDAMSSIRRRPRLAELPIIAFTAKDSDGERERCIAAGASDFIPKPIDTPDLLAAIDQWLPDAGPAPSAA
jgi:CheY-like chemotaxis protein